MNSTFKLSEITPENIIFCKRCLMPSTRPRIGYSDDGICNACHWSVEKHEEIDWQARMKELEELCENARNRNKNSFDCILPVSGGKDSSYVSYQMRDKMGMNCLAITLQPPLAFEVGNKNLENYINTGFNHLRITPNPKVGAHIALQSMIEQGQPLMAWIMSVQTVIFKCAVLFDIPLVMFGEEGEAEYGGSNKLKHKATYDLEDSIHIYLSGNDPRKFTNKFTEKELYWWMYPDLNDFRKLNPSIAHWSYFENWDSYRNYLVAKENFGLEEMPTRCVGTYNNFAQTDTKLYDLHCYFMYLKFGFGRCSQDVGIDIRRGAITRKQAINLVKKYDGEYPHEYIGDYLNYFNITKQQFDDIIDKWANKSILEKNSDGLWVKKFDIV
jgi:N-acetyl sugar amidotransferase